MENLVNIQEASNWASKLTNKDITESNISYLIQYGRINRYTNSGTTLVSLRELERYYSINRKKELNWKEKLGNDLNWDLSFDNYKESETTKHVHRLHPYKGKFIPQLVEYFLDSHTDSFKKDIFFKEGDIILDPFCGSGTTLVQANELGMHSIGIDISEFNTMISDSKITNYNISSLEETLKKINSRFNEFIANVNTQEFEKELLNELFMFNSKYFPSPEFKKAVLNKTINEKEYGQIKEKEFLPIFYSVTEKYKIDFSNFDKSCFLNTWYFITVRNEIFFINNLINQITDKITKQIFQIILSRTIRSCRATTHSDLATLIQPVYTTYYCTKHKKICKPLFSIKKWWDTYSLDTIQRLKEYNLLKTNTIQKCIVGDSRNTDFEKYIENNIPELLPIYNSNKIKGIFTSPPYVGLIDYHEQHAYAYELFSLNRRDEFEIGPLYKGYGNEAKKSYVDGIADVLTNCKKYLCDDYEVFLVANDKYNLYPLIAQKSNMKIVDTFKRPVLNRTEKDKNAYSEFIFRLKENTNL